MSESHCMHLPVYSFDIFFKYDRKYPWLIFNWMIVDSVNLSVLFNKYLTNLLPDAVIN